MSISFDLPTFPEAPKEALNEDVCRRVRLLLASLLRVLDVSNREAERRMGYSNHSGYLSRLFHGSRQLRLWQILQILEAVDFPPSVFFATVFPSKADDEAHRDAAAEAAAIAFHADLLR
jgi:hypothetical protein